MSNLIDERHDIENGGFWVILLGRVYYIIVGL